MALYYYFYALLILVTPLVYSSVTGFEIPKVILIRLLATCFAILFLPFYFTNKSKIHFDKYDLLGFFWILFTTVSSLLGNNFNYSFWGGVFRYQGILTQICLVLIFLTTRKVLLFYPKLINYIPGLLVFSGIIQAVLLIFQYTSIYVFQIDLSSYSGRVVGTLGQPNFAAGLILVALALIISKKSYKWSLLSGLLLLGIICTGSVAEILTFLVIISIVFFRGNTRVISKNMLGIILAIFFVVGVAAVRESARSKFLANPVESRLNIWPESLKLITKRPFVGYGADNFQFVFPDEHGGVSVDRAHNGLLDSLLVGGIFLGGVYLTIIYFGIKNGLTDAHIMPVGLAFLACVLREQVGVNSVINLMIFWLLFSIIANHKIKLASPKE